MVVEKLVSGVNVDRIISDARKITTEKIERIDTINRKDIAYLTKKHNVMKQGKGSESVLGDVAKMLAEEQPSNIKNDHNEEIGKFIEEKRCESQCVVPVDKEKKREIEIESVSNFLKSLDDETYDKYVALSTSYYI